MQIQKTQLASLPWIYAVSAFLIGGQQFFLAASELEGEGGSCLLIDPVSGRIETLWNAPGGVMSLVPVPEEEGTFLSIEEFYPVFKSERAAIYKTSVHLTEKGWEIHKREICRLPFAHRITLLQEPDGSYLAAANRCRSKKFVEDWSDPGGIYIGAYSGGTVTLEQILGGLSKNHGMYTQTTPAGDVLWIGAHEGLVRCWREDGQWKTAFVLREEISDICIADIDGDGEDELAVIEGFHGDKASVLKWCGSQYEKLATLPLQFGHVVWAGRLLGQSFLITSSRAGEMELAAHRAVSGPEGLFFETTVLDQGTGATQIAVVEKENAAWVFAADHETGSADLYTLRL